MQISEVYLGLGQDAFAHLIRSISIGKLKTYQIYEGFKVRAHLTKVNTEGLRKAVPKLWDRIAGGDDDFAKDLAQAILVSHLDMITAVLDFLGIPHENGFFAKDMDAKPYFTDGWEQRVTGEVPRCLSGAASPVLREPSALGTSERRGCVSPGDSECRVSSVRGVH